MPSGRNTAPRSSKKRSKRVVVDPELVRRIQYGEFLPIPPGARFDNDPLLVQQVASSSSFYMWTWKPFGSYPIEVCSIFGMSNQLSDTEKRSHLSVFGTNQPTLIGDLKFVFDRFIDLASLANVEVGAAEILLTLTASNFGIIARGLEGMPDAATQQAFWNCTAFALNLTGMVFVSPAMPLLATLSVYGLLNSACACSESLQHVYDVMNRERTRIDSLRDGDARRGDLPDGGDRDPRDPARADPADGPVILDPGGCQIGVDCPADINEPPSIEIIIR